MRRTSRNQAESPARRRFCRHRSKIALPRQNRHTAESRCDAALHRCRSTEHCDSLHRLLPVVRLVPFGCASTASDVCGLAMCRRLPSRRPATTQDLASRSILPRVAFQSSFISHCAQRLSQPRLSPTPAVHPVLARIRPSPAFSCFLPLPISRNSFLLLWPFPERRGWR